MADKIKVLIVDDASFMVKALSEMLGSDPDIEVVGVAKNGKEGLEKIKELKPDVITLDVDMPVMDGIRTVRHIMIESPVPIVMLSSLFNHGEITFEALRLGVVDFMPKPSGAISKDIHDERNKIIDRVKIAADEDIEKVRRVRVCKLDTRDRLSERYEYRQLDYLIAIGTTLGGPNTIINLMSQLSPDLPAAVVVIQEISQKILPAFVQKFNEYTAWRVEVGIEGTVIEQGVCYICAHNNPLVVKNNQNNEYCLVKGSHPEEPLNDLFSSAAEAFNENSIGVLLTGIGTDGSKGFMSIKEKSGTTIAQSTETCVYPNLTHTAIENGVVDTVTNSNQLASQIELTISRRHDE
ncbi:MAG: response regulator [Gammaproteobacteria bacterium]|nr:response regulator [Gammaproteobacteria bacterium]MDH5734545.1 response regulator [Gammaproteobacteria bacterium]